MTQITLFACEFSKILFNSIRFHSEASDVTSQSLYHVTLRPSLCSTPTPSIRTL
jgi:hypothetical protein